jgi:hypothetical protein
MASSSSRRSACANPAVIALGTITLFLALINHDSSIGKLKNWLKAEAARLGPGQRPPSTRWLVQARRVSPLTVSRGHLPPGHSRSCRYLLQVGQETETTTVISVLTVPPLV